MIELKGKYNQDCKIFLEEVEEGAIELVQNILNHEISEGVQVRIMPDTHVGKGIVIGFTMPMTTMVNPNYIGVDIGCSVTSYKLNKRFESEDLPRIDKVIRKAVPMGHAIRKGKDFNYWWVDEYFQIVTQNVNNFQNEWNKRFSDNKEAIIIDREYIVELCKKIGTGERMFYNSVGSLGGGNHFIEIGESAKDGSHYLTIHSGSRNFGLKVCNYHAKKMTAAKFRPQEYHDEFKYITQNTIPTSDIPIKLEELNERYGVGKKELLLKDDDMYEYLVDMVIAQTYAEFNHRAMAHSIFVGLRDVEAVDMVHSMHNFIDTRDWIIRKGAIRAYKGERMIIPFNMRDGLLICEGKSNADWNCSAPHGAGRILARNQAFKTLDMDVFKSEMEGIYSTSVCKSTLDEAPMAYKDKDVIINAIQDTATILDTVKPILNIKAN
ncbi:RtcB family protein [Dysgonomonas sp. 25]|uniref:RtcB family protein n=1 Tax=Dysgonomonas sp. 25 TaxID=2302933 RepID=UPI0013D0E0F3|nr:RtcB family protein [Dysgonomonas sp. 25]NDV67366.1 RNA-splicing ligase RtcB [Dysgonomonas sp. 25]